MQAEFWTLSGLAVELGRDRRSLARDLEGLDPDKIDRKGGRTERRWRMDRAIEHLFRPAEAGDLDSEQERARKDKETADKLAMENALRRGELAQTSVLAEIHGDEVARARARLIQIPDAVAQRFDHAIAPAIAAEVRRLIFEAMAELAGGTRDLSRRAARAVDTAADADGESVGRSGAAPVKRKQRRARAVAN